LICRFICAATNDCAKSREQFIQIKRFDEIIVRAGIQTFHAVARLVARGEHQHGSFFDFAKTFQNFPAVHFRQHHVEDDGVVVVIFGLVKSVLAVGRGVHGVAFLAQRLGEAAEQVWLVFDNQDSHVRRSCALFNTTVRRRHSRRRNLKGTLRRRPEYFRQKLKFIFIFTFS